MVNLIKSPLTGQPYIHPQLPFFIIITGMVQQHPHAS